MPLSKLLPILVFESLIPFHQAFFVFNPTTPVRNAIQSSLLATVTMSNTVNNTIIPAGTTSTTDTTTTSLIPAAVDGVEFCEIVDDFGCHALESHILSTTDKTERWVRLQATPDLPDMTQDEILKRIQQVEQQQSKYGKSNLYEREWITVDKTTTTNDPTRTFSVLQFNVLAQGLSFGPTTQPPFEPTQKLQEYKSKNSYGGFTSVAHPDVCLDFELRQWRLLQAMLDANCDIMALEEMDRFYGFFLPMLQKFGYEGLFIPKVHAPGVKLGWYSDGCAIFYRTSVFTVQGFDRHQFDVGNQVCLMARLCHRLTGKVVQIVATHLKAQQKQECEVMRKQQVNQLLQLLEKNRSEPEVSTIVAGDFNTSPSSESVKEVQQSLRSAYDLNDPKLVTTWKTRGSEMKKKIIDYLFYSADLKCTAKLSIPYTEIEEQQLPSLRYPSDHLLIAAKFQFPV